MSPSACQALEWRLRTKGLLALQPPYSAMPCGHCGCRPQLCQRLTRPGLRTPSPCFALKPHHLPSPSPLPSSAHRPRRHRLDQALPAFLLPSLGTSFFFPTMKADAEGGLWTGLGQSRIYFALRRGSSGPALLQGGGCPAGSHQLGPAGRQQEWRSWPC